MVNREEIVLETADRLKKERNIMADEQREMEEGMEAQQQDREMQRQQEEAERARDQRIAEDQQVAEAMEKEMMLLADPCPRCKEHEVEADISDKIIKGQVQEIEELKARCKGLEAERDAESEKASRALTHAATLLASLSPSDWIGYPGQPFINLANGFIIGKGDNKADKPSIAFSDTSAGTTTFTWPFDTPSERDAVLAEIRKGRVKMIVVDKEVK